MNRLPTTSPFRLAAEIDRTLAQNELLTMVTIGSKRARVESGCKTNWKSGLSLEVHIMAHAWFPRCGNLNQ
jgi:hypothetical protein